MSMADAAAELAVSRGGPAVTFATTEHFNLQTARALTASEANGRASIYLAAPSGNLIALAFVGQMSRLGATLWVRADSVVGVGVRERGHVPASGSVLDRGPRIRASRRAPTQLLPAGRAGARAVPRRCLGSTLPCAAPTQRMATDAHRRRHGCGGQQCRAGGVRRSGTGSGGRPLACDSGCRRSSHRICCLHVARTPPPSRARRLQPRDCRSGRDRRPTVAAGRRGVKERSLCRRSHVAFEVTARKLTMRTARRASRSSTTSPVDGDQRAAVSLAGTRDDRAPAR